MINQKTKGYLLALLEEGAFEIVIVDYISGKYNNDSETKSIIEDSIIDNPKVQKFYKDYTTALNSKTDEEWKRDADKSLERIKSKIKIS